MPQPEYYHPERTQKIKGKSLRDIEKGLYEDKVKKLEEEEIAKYLEEEVKGIENLTSVDKKEKDN